MHEYSLVAALCERAAAEADRRHARRIDKLVVSVGELAGVERELFRTAFETFRAATACAQATLEIRDVPARWRCGACGAELLPEEPKRCCGLPARLSAGDELILERIEMEVDDVS
jgi:hydrogenase nickel incorporation protein HypA/HybF